MSSYVWATSSLLDCRAFGRGFFAFTYKLTQVTLHPNVHEVGKSDRENKKTMERGRLAGPFPFGACDLAYQIFWAWSVL